MPKLSPTPAQIDFVSTLIEWFPSSEKIEAWMDDENGDNEMMISLTDDGMTQHAIVDNNGTIVGNWF